MWKYIGLLYKRKDFNYNQLGCRRGITGKCQSYIVSKLVFNVERKSGISGTTILFSKFNP
jgi:hypothetical protein